MASTGLGGGAGVGEPAQPQEHHPNIPRLVIQNVTASVNVHTKLDLNTIAQRLRNAEYNPRKLPACVMRIREPKATGLLFASGKVVVTGAQGKEAAREAARKFVAVLESLQYKPAFLGFTIQNMVATADIGFPVSLELLAYSQARWCSYEPELFPGVIYKAPRSRVVVHIFLTGRLVLTGVKVTEQFVSAMEYLTPILHQFRARDLNGDFMPRLVPSLHPG